MGLGDLFGKGGYLVCYVMSLRVFEGERFVIPALY